MSIPTPFNPLGTLGGGKRVYPQALMTSSTRATDIDGKPLPGAFSVSGGDVYSGRLAWHAFDGVAGTNARLLAETSIGIDFGIPVTISDLEVNSYGEGVSASSLQLQAFIGGEWVAASGYFSSPTTGKIEAKPVSVSGKTPQWRLHNAASNKTVRVIQINYNATY